MLVTLSEAPKARSRSADGTSSSVGTFHEKAGFVKPDVAASFMLTVAAGLGLVSIRTHSKSLWTWCTLRFFLKGCCNFDFGLIAGPSANSQSPNAAFDLRRNLP